MEIEGINRPVYINGMYIGIAHKMQIEVTFDGVHSWKGPGYTAKVKTGDELYIEGEFDVVESSSEPVSVRGSKPVHTVAPDESLVLEWWSKNHE